MSSGRPRPICLHAREGSGEEGSGAAASDATAVIITLGQVFFVSPLEQQRGGGCQALLSCLLLLLLLLLFCQEMPAELCRTRLWALPAHASPWCLCPIVVPGHHGKGQVSSAGAWSPC